MSDQYGSSQRGAYRHDNYGGRNRDRIKTSSAGGFKGNNDALRARDNGYGARAERTGYDSNMPAPMSQGKFACDFVDLSPPSGSETVTSPPYQCKFTCHSALMLTLHKADRHLIYPAGGLEELKRQDPMLVAEEKERLRRQRQTGRSRARAPHPLPNRPDLPATSSGGHSLQSNSGDDAFEDDESADKHGKSFDGPPDATIAGLNIQLDSPELIAEWIKQRKKRWPTRKVVEEKIKEKEERQKRSELLYGPRLSGRKRPRDFDEPLVRSAAMITSKTAKPNSELASSELESKPKRKEQNSDSESDARCEVPAATSNVDPSIPSDNDRSSESDVNTSALPEIGADTSSESDSDDAPEESSSKVPVAALTKSVSADTDNDRRPVCKHFLQGRCSFGDQCRKQHVSSSQVNLPTAQLQKQRRPQPRPAPVNPFDQPDLLRQLLRNEIDKHVDAVGQAIRFIVENDMLLHVETNEGQAEAQKARRSLVQVLSSSEQTDGHAPITTEAREELTKPLISEPLVQGGLAITRSATETGASSTDTLPAANPSSSLFRPSSPDLRPLSELRYPPDPDPLIFLDPLRRDDPKPLLPGQLLRIAKDTVVRSVLTPSSILHPNGAKEKGLERAIVSLDALPSDFHRNAAIEMILGVSNGSVTPGSSAGLMVKSRDGRRKISESDLFRMGLRVGGDEVMSIKKLADRLTFLLDTTLQLDQADTQDWSLLDANQRDQMRRKHFAIEADRLDRLRKLGIDV